MADNILSNVSQATLERIYRGSSSRAHGRPSIFGITEKDLAAAKSK